MKKIYFLLILLLSITSQAQNCDLGNKNLTNPSSFTRNFLLGIKYTLNQESTLRSLNLMGNGSNTTVQMALYADSNGVPNDLVVASAQGTVSTGQVSLPVTPTLLVPGDYWILAVYGSDGDHTGMLPSNLSTDVVYYKSFSIGGVIPSNASNFSKYTGQIFNYFLGLDCGDTLSLDTYDNENSVTLYPNPAKDFVQVNGIDKLTNYTIYNTLGSMVKKGSIDVNQQINTQDLQSGVYMISIENKGSLKFIKK